MRSRTLCGLILAMLVAVAGSPSSALDRSQLEPVPAPDLSSFEEPIRDRLVGLQERVESLRSDSSDAELAEAYGALAKHYLAHSLNEAARASFANAHSLAPQDLRWTYYLANVEERLGNHEAAVGLYHRALEIAPDDVPTLLHLGEVELEMGDNEAASDAFAKALELAPDEAAAYAGLGRAAAALGQTEDAIEYFRRALELQPQADALHYRLALAYRKVGRTEEARAELGKRGETEVRFVDPLLNEIGPLQRGDLVEAVVEMAGTPDEVEDRALADFAVGHLSADPDAPHKLRIAIDTLSDGGGDGRVRARLHYVIGGLYFTRNQLDRSRAELDSALALAPNMVAAGLLLGRIQERQDDPEDALTTYSHLLAEDPENVDALHSRARVRTQLDDSRGAADDYARLCELEPTRSGNWIQLAVAHARLGEFDLARDEYRKALELGLDPIEAAQVHYHLGIIESREGTLDQAVAELRDAVALDPALVAAGLDLGAALGNLGRYQEAAAAYRQVLDQDPAVIAAWLGEATALELAGDPGHALEVLEAGWAEHPGSVDLLHALARFLASADDLSVRDGERALELARRTFRAGSTVERLETLAMAYAENGLFKDAVKTQKEAIAMAGWQGRAELVPVLEANLQRYERGLSCCAEKSGN